MKVTLFAAVLWLVLCLGCTSKSYRSEGDGGSVAAPVASPISLPAPQTLRSKIPAPRAASYTVADLTRLGKDYDPALPSKRVAVAGNSLEFAPDWDHPTKTDFAGLSFASYVFSVKGYAGSPVIRYTWGTLPDKPGNAYFAVANWNHDRWDWFRGNAANTITLPELEDYLDFGGNLLVCVLRVGIDVSVLDALYLGTAPPVAQLSASPDFGLAPLAVEFDASASIDPDGTIVQYTWDPEGDGNFVSSGSDPTFSHEYAVAGDYVPVVRVFDDSGTYSDSSLPVKAQGDTFMTFGLEAVPESVTASLVSSDGDLCLFGNINDSPFNGLFVKIGPDGTPRFLKQWGGAAGSYFTDAALLQDGNICVCGSTSQGGLLQLWTSAGALLWNKQVTSTAGDTVDFHAVAVTDDAIYICGRMYLLSVSKSVGLLMRFDLSGNRVWKSTVIATGGMTLYDLAIQQNSEGLPLSVQACGNYSQPSDTDVLYVHHTLDGDQNFATTWGEAGNHESGESILLAGPDQSVTYMAGKGTVGFLNQGLLLRYNDKAVRMTSPGGGISGIELVVTPRSDFSLLTAAAGYLTIDDFNSDLALLGGDKVVLASEQLIPVALSNFGEAGLFIVGTSTGPGTLTLSATDDIVETSSVQWIGLSPSIGNPSLQVTDLVLDTYDRANFELNNPAEVYHDPFLYIKSHQ